MTAELTISPQAALARAKRQAGGPGKLADRLGITSQAVVQWEIVPALRVLAVEAASGVSRHELRPDLYPFERTGLPPAERAA